MLASLDREDEEPYYAWAWKSANHPSVPGEDTKLTVMRFAKTLFSKQFLWQLWNRIKVKKPLGPGRLMLQFVGGYCRGICGGQNPLLWQNRFYDLYACCEDKTDISLSMHNMENLAGAPVSGRQALYLKISFQGVRFSREPHRPVERQIIRSTVCGFFTCAKIRAVLKSISVAFSIRLYTNTKSVS